jgi:hypothetical protein
MHKAIKEAFRQAINAHSGIDLELMRNNECLTGARPSLNFQLTDLERSNIDNPAPFD